MKKHKNLKTEIKQTYFSYKYRIIIYVLLFLIFFVTTITCVLNSFSIAKEKVINYSAQSSLDYDVELKDNDFYDSNTLPKDMVYVASLIKNIPLIFNYSFSTSDKVDMDFEYSISAKLNITDPDNSKSYYQKEYTLLAPKTGHISENNEFNISEKINLDYDTYNAIANSFKANYGLESNSDLTIYLTVRKIPTDENNIVIGGNDVMTFTVPLSEKAINISLNYKDIDENSTIVNHSTILVSNYVFIFAALVSLFLTMMYAIKLLRLLNLSKNKVSMHDKAVKKIIKEYDRLVVETSNLPSYDNKEVVKIPSFEELLDVRDNIKLPIMHYIVTKHQKSIFYINYNNTLYVYVIKNTDLENK